MNGLESAWVPYGISPSLCPGRHFAKQKMIGSFALSVAYFEIELLQNGSDKNESSSKSIKYLDPDIRFFALGALPKHCL